MKSYLLLFAILFSASSSWAFTPRAYEPNFQCPETHPEYTKLLKNLREFQAQLKANSDCQELSLDLEGFTSLLGEEREEFLKVISRNENGVLDALSTEKIQNYSSAVTEQVATLIRLISGTDGGGILSIFTGTDRCVLEEEDQFAAVQRVTSAAYEASKLISKVAGPYGVPISIAANTMFGVIQGLQNFIDKSEPIDFDEPEKREFFAESLCLFASFEEDIRKLNNPQSHLQALEKVKLEASQAMDEISTLCEECDLMIFSDITEESKGEILSSMTNQELGEKTLIAKQNLEWIDEEIAKFKEILDFPTKGIGPRELQSIKIILSDFLLKTASPSFMEWYLDKSVDQQSKITRKLSSAHQYVVRQMRDDKVPVSFRLPENPHGQNAFLIYPRDLILLHSLNQKLAATQHSPLTYSVLRETFEGWKLAEQNLKVVNEYCNFLASNLLYPKNVQEVCESYRKSLRDGTVAYQAFMLADLFEDSQEMSVIGPFDFSLDYHMKVFPSDLAAPFVDAARLLEESKSGKTLNLISKTEKATSVIFSSWEEASEEHINNFVEEFRVIRN